MLIYIGDFDKLKDYGFNMYEEYAMKQTDYRYENSGDIHYDSVYIQLNNDGSLNEVLWNYIYNESPVENYIQDLIKDGLVIERHQ